MLLILRRPLFRQYSLHMSEEAASADEDVVLLGLVDIALIGLSVPGVRARLHRRTLRLFETVTAGFDIF